MVYLLVYQATDDGGRLEEGADTETQSTVRTAREEVRRCSCVVPTRFFPPGGRGGGGGEREKMTAVF